MKCLCTFCWKCHNLTVRAHPRTLKVYTLFIKWSHRRKVEKFKDNNVLTLLTLVSIDFLPCTNTVK